MLPYSPSQQIIEGAMMVLSVSSPHTISDLLSYAGLLLQAEGI